MLVSRCFDLRGCLPPGVSRILWQERGKVGNQSQPATERMGSYEAASENRNLMAVRILLVDDHPIVRQGLRNLLEGRSGWEVVGEASDGIEALDKVETLQPDVV